MTWIYINVKAKAESVSGGLVCRGILSTLPDHNVHSFISLSSPQAGQYGGNTLSSVLLSWFNTELKCLDSLRVSGFAHVCSSFVDTDYLKYLFPQFVKSNLYHVCYTAVGQKISICNYWNGEWMNGPENRPVPKPFTGLGAKSHQKMSLHN